MKVVLQSVLINDPRSTYFGSIKDILVKDGIIMSIEDNIGTEDAVVFKEQGCVASPGWVDTFAHFNDPGTEYKETIESGAEAAAAGGFTTVLVLPNTQPVIDTKSAVEYIMAKNDRLPTRVLPIGAVTRRAEGKELAEMYDMSTNGAAAFSDGLYPIQSSGILVKALQYLKAINGVLIQVPDDTSLSANGLMNEGVISTRLGLPGKPMMAEELLVARDIKLARYTQSRIHFTGVTSPKSIDYISRAKASGLAVTCSVTPYHLFFSDEDLMDYDTQLKVNPPLRTVKDRDALREAVLNGVVDTIATHHFPHDFDAKIVEFEYAKYGMIGLESAYGAVKAAIPGISETRLGELFSLNARKIFNLPDARVEAGQPAAITLHLPENSFVFSKEHIRSKSDNSAFFGKPLKGRIAGTISGKHYRFNKLS
ncbi:dihydroorotase [Flavihumibacter petaseus]|nr:dihydroorotase [Flavihumibacter petaseus]